MAGMQERATCNHRRNPASSQARKAHSMTTLTKQRIAGAAIVLLFVILWILADWR
jgi:hypothetical protein